VKDLGFFEYSKENLKRAETLLKNGDLNQLSELTPARFLLGKDSAVICFNDQKSIEYVALV
jgi:hypothetical protein